MADYEIDDDNIFDEGELEDDGTADIIRKAYEESMKDEEDDDGGFDQPLDAKSGEEPDVVSPDKGRDLLDDAEMAKAKGKNPESESKPAEEAKSEAEKKPDGEETGGKDEGKDGGDPEGANKSQPEDLKSSDLNALLDGVPDDRKGEITRRIRDAESALQPFNNPYIQAQMKQFGATPKDVASRLVDLASFASNNPSEYIAWVAKESASPEKIGEVIENAAKLLGYKLTKEGEGGDDDDMFSDPQTKALKEENDRLKAQLAGKQQAFGPDTPERMQTRTVQQQLQSFISEVDDAGQPKRPYFDHLRPRISDLATLHRNRTGQAVTTDDLQRFYDQALNEARAAFGTPATPTQQPAQGSAAQSEKPVADHIKEKAAAAERAQKASKSIDGTGQGASRRPALSADASLDDVIRHFASKE